MKEHLRVIAPAWPLQNTVAVNPFWNQIDKPFSEVMAKMAYLVHRPLYMPISYFLEKYGDGVITDQDFGSDNLEHVLRASAEAVAALNKCYSFTDFLDDRLGLEWNSFVTYEIGKYASAFFDEGQALARFPWRDLSFFDAWFVVQEFDRSFQKFGVDQFRDLIAEFCKLDPEFAIQTIASRFGFVNEQELNLYVGRLSVRNIGWASQFSYHEWRDQLGYATTVKIQSVELVAVQMIVDYAIAASFESSHPGITKAWLASFQTAASQQKSLPDQFELNRIWQAALERSRQRQVAAQIKPCEQASTLPKVQIAMCIDVRSETYRRAIESTSNEIETIGFAGFFGLPFEYKKIDEKSPGARAPVLLKAGFTVKEEMISRSPARQLARTLARSYFRNLRKAPLSSFLFVELFSLLACGKLLRSLLDSLKSSDQSTVSKKFSDGATRPSQISISLSDNQPISLQTKVEMAAKILAHMGLKSRFGRLVILAGHGSQNANNAFASASDCGACGGHSGDVNARFLADLLNDPEIRAGLQNHSIQVPESTRFLAAVHETVTDELYLLDQSQIPESHQDDLATVLASIKIARHKATTERQLERSSRLDPSASRRTKNWSEVRPEWALAGNSCFIVAPRRFTRAADFEGRSFLHDYDWRSDTGFETLELIMTAPMLVTNWINFQYYASTVAPKIFSSGNKVLHNLVNETGVLEGNGGDLRIGLPWQSINDGEEFVHEPVRLAVYIAAPIAEIEKVIAKHPAVRNLVVNEWIYLFHIDDKTGKIERLI